MLFFNLNCFLTTYGHMIVEMVAIVIMKIA